MATVPSAIAVDVPTGRTLVGKLKWIREMKMEEKMRDKEESTFVKEMQRLSRQCQQI